MQKREYAKFERVNSIDTQTKCTLKGPVEIHQRTEYQMFNALAAVMLITKTYWAGGWQPCLKVPVIFLIKNYKQNFFNTFMVF